MSSAELKTFIENARGSGASDTKIFLAIMDSPKFKKGIEKGNAQGLTNRQIAAGIGLNIPRAAVDLKAETQKEVKKQAKAAGPTKAWESALLGFSDLGSGVIQGALYAKDAVTGGNSYNKFTKQRADIENYHEMRRQESNQGFDWWRLGGQVAATAPLGATVKGFQGAKVLSQPGAKVLAQNAAIGAAIGGTGFAKDSKHRAANTILGGVGGAGGAVVGDKIGKALASAARHLNPSNATAQQIDTVINVSLSQSDDAAVRNLKVTDLDQTTREALRKQVKTLLKQGKSADPKAVERAAVFNDLKSKGVDLRPTGKQATGNPQLWTKETELSKLDGAGALNERYIQQHQIFSQNLDDLATTTGGTSLHARGTGESVINALNQQDGARKQIIADLYKTAKDHTGNDLLLDASAVARNVHQLVDDNFALPDRAIPQIMKRLKPFLPNPNDSTHVPQPFTLRDKELIVKQINSALPSMDMQNKHAFSLVRDALEQETDDALTRVGTSLQGDAKASWEAARQSARDRFKLIERTPALQRAIDDAAPDQFFEKNVISKSAAYRDVKALVDEIKGNPEAMNNARLEIIRFISSHAVSPQSGATSPAGMRRALDQIGDDKLKLFFSDAEVKHLTNLGAAAKYLHSQPVGSNVNHSNSSSAFMNLLGYMNVLKKIPVVGDKLNQMASAAPRAVNAQIKINQGAKAIQQTATPNPSTLDTQTRKWLMQMGMLGGSNAATE